MVVTYTEALHLEVVTPGTLTHAGRATHSGSDRRIPMPPAIQPFRIAASDAALDDLRGACAPRAGPSARPSTTGRRASRSPTCRTSARYWAEKYDWRAREARLNRFPQFRTELDGLGIHFLHVRSPHADALPLVITHGWPGSIVEFQKVIEPLTNPTAHGGEARDAFHVVCPSLPGYGFSRQAGARRAGTSSASRSAWAALMERLGYARYVAQGGDWGAMVTTCDRHRRTPSTAPASTSTCRSRRPTRRR